MKPVRELEWALSRIEHESPQHGPVILKYIDELKKKLEALMKNSNYQVVSQDEKQVTLQDVGPWDRHRTVTNDADRVVEELVPTLHGRRLFYYDSEGDLTELVIKDGKLAGFQVVSAL